MTVQTLVAASVGAGVMGGKHMANGRNDALGILLNLNAASAL